jgi:hypothetical protein
LHRGTLSLLSNNEVKYFSPEVNDLFWTPEASALFGAKTAGKSRRNRRKWRLKSVDASGVRFGSFTLQEKY